jgi:predicted dehydrogenase
VWVYQYFAHRSFAHALRAGRAPSPGFDDALIAHALVEAAYRSCASGQPEAVGPLLATPT